MNFWTNSNLKNEVTKFTVVGLFNAVLTFVVFFSLLQLLNINYLISFSVSWGTGVIFSYILNYLWVFKPEHRLQFKRRFIKYFFAYLISFFFNLVALGGIVETTKLNPFLVQCALIPFIVALNFTTSKFWSLRPNDTHHEK